MKQEMTIADLKKKGPVVGKVFSLPKTNSVFVVVKDLPEGVVGCLFYGPVWRTPLYSEKNFKDGRKIIVEDRKDWEERFSDRWYQLYLRYSDLVDTTDL